MSLFQNKKFTALDFINPVHEILNSVELLLQTEPRTPEYQLMDVIKRAALAMLAQVQDEADRLQLENGNLEIKESEFSLAELLGTLGYKAMATAERSGVTFSMKLAPDLPDEVVGDSTKLNLIISDLSTALLESASQGKAELSVSTSVDSLGRTMIRVEATRLDATDSVQRLNVTQVFRDLVLLLGGSTENDSLAPSSGTFAIVLPVRQVQAMQHASPMADISSRTLDPSVIEVLRPLQELGDKNIFEELAHDFVDMSHEQLARMNFAISTGDSRLAAHEAFNLKTSAASMGAQRMTVLCARAEHHAREGELSKLKIVMHDIAKELQCASGELKGLAAHFSIKQLIGCRILVVDDEPEIVELLSDFLIDRGAAVLHAPDGAQALHMAKSHTLDLIVSDFAMPKLNGIELLNQLRSESTTTPPFFLISGHLEAGSKEAKVAGASGIFSKPLDEEALSSALRQAWRAVP